VCVVRGAWCVVGVRVVRVRCVVGVRVVRVRCVVRGAWCVVRGAWCVGVRGREKDRKRSGPGHVLTVSDFITVDRFGHFGHVHFFLGQHCGLSFT